jgi:cyclic beta-1,2-glucan synthetase
MQRAGVESILGLRVRGAFLHLEPCIPKAWPKFEISVRRQSARYEFVVDNPAGVSCGVRSAEIDGVEIAERPLRLPMVDDGAVHRVHVTLG